MPGVGIGEPYGGRTPYDDLPDYVDEADRFLRELEHGLTKPRTRLEARLVDLLQGLRSVLEEETGL